MKNYVQAGEILTVPAPYDVSSGGGALVGSIFGVASENALDGEDVDLAVEGVFALDKVGADVFTVGEFAYWDDTAKLVTATASGNTKIGVATAAAGDGAATVNVRLNESF